MPGPTSLRARAVAVSLVLLCSVALVGSSTAATAEAADLAPSSTTGITAASSSGDAPALSDGDPKSQRLGAEWAASTADPRPWAELRWPSARRIASVQIFGSSRPAFDPKQSTAAALHGTLHFSDGSTVIVSGVAPDAGMPTTVAFTGRATSWVRFDIERQIASADVALRELTAYPAGSTPPQWDAPASSPSYSTVPLPASCSATSPSVAPVTEGRLTLACPGPGTSVGDSAVVAVNAPPGVALTAWVSSTGSVRLPLRRAASGAADAAGRALLVADLRRVPRGPVTLKVGVAPGASTVMAPLYVQLVHSTGTSVEAGVGSSPPTGMTLQFSDDFDGPLSISQSGWGATYAAVKPEPWGGSQFGEAVFADPEWGADTLSTLPGGYLRIRNQQIGSYASRQSWGQAHISGILSSQRFGGSGFSAQYGYFEARIMGAPGPGAWPAFWMMNSEAGTGRSNGSGELDAVELYGHDPHNACHTTHTWALVKKGQLLCRDYPMDWAAEWHTYGVRVIPGAAEVFVDGKLVTTLADLSHTDQPFFFMLDLATGGGWPVDLSATGQTTDMYVDWVRVWT